MPKPFYRPRGPWLPLAVHQAVPQAVEVALAAAHVRGQTRTRVVERLDDQERGRAGQAAAEHVDAEGLPRALGALVPREERLEEVLEREVEGLRGEVAQHVGEVAAPEGRQALLGVDAREAVADAGLARHLARLDTRVRVLRLDHELDTLNGCSARLGDGTAHATGHEVNQEVFG